MASIPFVVRGMFGTPRPNPKTTQPPWVGFQVEAAAVVDLDAGEVRGFQGLIREVPADPSQESKADSSEPFTVPLTTAPDAVNPHPQGDVGAIRAVLDARIAALAVEPKRTFTVALSGNGIGVAFEPLRFEPTAEDVQTIMGIVLMRAKLVDTMGVYGPDITITVNGQMV